MTGPDLYKMACQYARGLDANEPVRLRELFHRDGAVVGLRHRFDGIDEVARIPDVLKQRYASTMHMVGNAFVGHESGDIATGETYCTAYHVREGAAESVYTMAIRYQDVLVRDRDRWVFLQRDIRTVWTNTFSCDPRPPR